ncbi:protein slit-like isoform X2 [Diorhabda carinulata]|nr:protein slit-like isoform X2 [Diorhabda carinulata]
MKISLKKCAIVVLMHLITISYMVEARCPSMCNCTQETVFCISRNIEKIPNFDPLENNPVVIDLSGNKIALIGPDDLSFEKSMYVKELYLNYSEIIDIDNEAFDDLENLQELYLGDNLLRVIPDDFIQELTDMVLLDLSGNPFEGEMPVIKSESLELLALSNCQITKVSSEALKYLPNLRMLLLHENNIQYINPEVFEPLSEIFLKLSYNTWMCNCKTMELFDYLSQKNFIDTSEPYQCIFNNVSYNIFEFQQSEEHSTMCEVNYTQNIKETGEEQSVGNLIVINDSEDAAIDISQGHFYDEIDHEEQHAILEQMNKNGETSILSLRIFLIAILNFVMGVFFGVFLNHFAKVRKQLEMSDSTSQLINSVE